MLRGGGGGMVCRTYENLFLDFMSAGISIRYIPLMKVRLFQVHVCISRSIANE